MAHLNDPITMSYQTVQWFLEKNDFKHFPSSLGPIKFDINVFVFLDCPFSFL